MPTTSINIRQQMMAKSHSGASQRKIATDLKISRTAVYDAIKKMEKCGCIN